jgi:GT2 family glycosyltransferase
MVFAPNPATYERAHADVAPVRIAVGIATAGRADTLLKTVGLLAHQLRSADAIFVCAPADSDVRSIEDLSTVRIIVGPSGLTRQRNVILDAAAQTADVLVFIDDDFLPGRAYLQETLAVFAAKPDVVMTTGHVVQDGILGPGLEFDSAIAQLAAHDERPCRPESVRDVYNGYGCNMAVRLAAVSIHGLRFDEGLPLYGWLEDIDFSRRFAKYGRIVAVPTAKGIHLGIKSGRQSGVRLGYSQIANPYYLAQKGSCSWRRGLYLVSRNIAANLRGLVHPEPHVDRVGRINGNLKALADLVSGRLSPLRILSL